MSERFSDPIDQDIRTQWALSWKIVVSEWRSVIAVLLNVGGGVRLIKPAKLCMFTQNTTNTTRTDARRRMCAAIVPYRWATRGTSLRELEYTHTHTYSHTNTECHFVSWAHSVNTPSQWIKLSYMIIVVHRLVGSIFTPLALQVTLLCAGNQTPRQRSPVFKGKQTGSPSRDCIVFVRGTTVELQWLEHWWLVYHGCFELVLGSLGTNPVIADLA